jgi:hypothetical protein
MKYPSKTTIPALIAMTVAVILPGWVIRFPLKIRMKEEGGRMKVHKTGFIATNENYKAAYSSFILLPLQASP